MLSRRAFLHCSAASLALVACTDTDPVPPPADLPDVTVDIHAHIFNATDVPIAGFLTHVFLRSPEDPEPPSSFRRALAQLVEDIAVFGVSTAAEELARLPGGGALPQTPPEALAAADQEAVAQGVARLEDRVAAPASLSGFDDRAEEDTILLDALYAEAGLPDRDIASLDSTTTSRADAVAAAAFAPPGFNLRLLGGEDFSLFQHLRWAALLRRDRRDILARLTELYHGTGDRDGGVKIFSPSIVDFEFWLTKRTGPRFSPLSDQLAVMSRLARLDSNVLILNFAPFCPLRALSDRKRGRDPLRFVKRAVNQLGFVGVKLYPPMGFKPWENENAPAGFDGRLRYTGAELDRELRGLYRWCVQNAVPLKSHGNNSLAAQSCSGQNAAPNLWTRVFEAYPDLKVNIAHFGGFEELEEDPNDACQENPPSYERRASDLIRQTDGAYVDLGYWTDVVGNNAPGRDFTDRINALLADNAKLGQHIMYGSDFSMIGRVKQHEAYLQDVTQAIERLDGNLKDRIMSKNALVYLGLTDASNPARKRLAKFFPPGHLYFDLFPDTA